MKAITPVIALVMLMLITVGMVGISYTWFSGMLSTSTEKTVVVPAGGIYCGKNKISAVIQNAGASSDITDNDIIFADVNGVNVKNSLFFGDFDRSGLVGYWRFEQSNGSAATNDSSGYGNMGTLTNMNLTGNTSSGLTQGRFGNALLFDGVNDYVNVGNLGNFYSQGSIEFWMNPSVVENWRNPFTTNYNGGNVGIRFEESTTGAFGAIIGNDTGDFGGASDIYLASGLTANRWYHVVLNWDTTLNQVSGYLDGVQKFNDAHTQWPTTLPAVTIGEGFDLTRYWKGLIDEVMIWNRTLSAPEIAQLNRTGSGNFTIGPGQGKTVITNYPVFQPGKYTVRIGTRTNVVEAAVNCQ